MSEWFESFFDALAHDVWDALVPPEASDLEAEWLLRGLELPEGKPCILLDAPSGRGRLARRLAAHGHHVVAVDFAPAAIGPLTAAHVPGIDARLGDLRDLPAILGDGTTFEGAYCMGNSFGYLDIDATDRFLAGVASVLRPGARFVIDAATVAEALLPHLETGDAERHEAGAVALTNTHRYEAHTSTLVTDMVLERDGRRDERVVRHRVMTCREVVDGLARAGFVLERISGELDGRPFTVGAPRCLITAVRRADGAPASTGGA